MFHYEPRDIFRLLFVHLCLDLEHTRHLALELAMPLQVSDPVEHHHQFFIFQADQPVEFPLVNGIDLCHAAFELLNLLLVVVDDHLVRSALSFLLFICTLLLV